MSNYFTDDVSNVTSLEYNLDGMSSDVQHWIVSAAQKYDEYLSQQPAQEPSLEDRLKYSRETGNAFIHQPALEAL